MDSRKRKDLSDSLGASPRQGKSKAPKHDPVPYHGTDPKHGVDKIPASSLPIPVPNHGASSRQGKSKAPKHDHDKALTSSLPPVPSHGTAPKHGVDKIPASSLPLPAPNHGKGKVAPSAPKHAKDKVSASSRVLPVPYHANPNPLPDVDKLTRKQWIPFLQFHDEYGYNDDYEPSDHEGSVSDDD